MGGRRRSAPRDHAPAARIGGPRQRMAVADMVLIDDVQPAVHVQHLAHMPPRGNRRTARGETWFGYSFVPGDLHPLPSASSPGAPEICASLVGLIAWVRPDAKELKAGQSRLENRLVAVEKEQARTSGLLKGLGLTGRAKPDSQPRPAVGD